MIVIESIINYYMKGILRVYEFLYESTKIEMNNCSNIYVRKSDSIIKGIFLLILAISGNFIGETLG